jgi:tetratricopeptide (TPR) repeat protein
VHVLLSGIAIRQDRFADAIRHAEASLLVDPQQVLARWFYGVALKGNARYAEALKTFRKILASSTTAPRSANDVVIDDWKVRFHMGFCLEQVGELDAAAEQYVQVVEQYRGSEDPLNGFFRTVEKRSDVAVVLGQFKRLIACMPDHIHLRLNHALILHAVGCTDEALTELHGLEEKFPTEHDPYVVEANWMAANGSDQLQPIVERARAHEALSFPLVRLVIERFLRNKEYSHAMALLDELIDSHTVEIPSEVRLKYVGLRQKLGAQVISSQNR